MLLQENFDDILEIKKEISLNDLNLVFVNNMDEVLNAALVENPFKKAKLRKSTKQKSRKRTK